MYRKSLNGRSAGLRPGHFRGSEQVAAQSQAPSAGNIERLALTKAKSLVRRYAVVCLMGAFVTGLVIGKLVKR